MNAPVAWMLVVSVLVVWALVMAGCYIARGVTLLLGMPELDAWMRGEGD